MKSRQLRNDAATHPFRDDPAYWERIRRKADEAPPLSEKQRAHLGAIWAPRVLAQAEAKHNDDRAEAKHNDDRAA